MGNKLNRIFNERFLVDLVNIATISKRYYRWNIAWVFICVVVTSWVFITQDKVQHRELRFFPMQKSEASAQALMPEVPFMRNNKNEEMDIREIWRITSSRSFVQAIYEKASNDGKLEDFAFYKHGQRLSYGRIATECSLESNCIREKMIDILGSMYSVKRNIDVPGFTLKTYSFDAEDTKYLEKLLVKQIRSTRQNHLMAEIDLKIKLAEEAYARKKESTHLDLFEQKTAALRSVEAKIVDVDVRIKSMQAARDLEQSKMVNLSLQYREATKDEVASVNSKSRKKSERVRALESEVSQLQENLELLRLSAGSNSVIIAKLEKRLRSASSELVRIGKTAPTRSLSSVQKAKNSEIPDMAMAAKVSKQNVVKLEDDISTLLASREDMTRQAGGLEREIKELTPDIEMLLSLENRLKMLRIDKVTTTADLLFEEIPQVVESLMRHSIRKTFFIFVFSVGLGCLALTLLLYLFDDRIHDADELLTVAPDLKIVGKVANLDI